jgi:hypothetical protein
LKVKAEIFNAGAGDVCVVINVIYRDVCTQQKERKMFAMFRAVQYKLYLLQYISLVRYSHKRMLLSSYASRFKGLSLLWGHCVKGRERKDFAYQDSQTNVLTVQSSTCK